jgi:hypothetical protein
MDARGNGLSDRPLDATAYADELIAGDALAVMDASGTATAARRPFLYFPLRDHCEQNFHVRHRLDRYRAGRCMDFDEASPHNVAMAIESLMSRPVDYAEVEAGTALAAARSIAELL